MSHESGRKHDVTWFGLVFTHHSLLITHHSLRYRLGRERLWLLAWWRWACGHRRCVLCGLLRRRAWATLDALLLGDDA
jgi:hypothetical protein